MPVALAVLATAIPALAIGTSVMSSSPGTLGSSDLTVPLTSTTVAWLEILVTPVEIASTLTVNRTTALEPPSTTPGFAPGLCTSVAGEVREYGMTPAGSATATPLSVVESGTYVVFAGMTSETVAPTEGILPRLATRTVYVMRSPALTDGVAVETVLRTRSSERGSAHEPRSPRDPTPEVPACLTKVLAPVAMSTR